MKPLHGIALSLNPTLVFPLRHRSLTRHSVTLTAACLVSACGGGDDAAVVAATADNFTLGATQSAQLLANDRIGDTLAVAGSGGNAIFTLSSGALPAGLTVTDGLVSVDATAVPGELNFSYQLCEAANAANCASATALITVPAPPIIASADTFNLAAGQSGDVLANDSLGGTPATALRVSVVATGTLPAGITLSAAGLVSVDASAVPASYAVGYRICQIAASSNCATTTATVVVPALGALSGRAIDSATALGVPGVRVSANGISSVTDSTGAFMLTGVPASERATVVFASDIYASTSRIASVSGSRAADVQARLVRIASATDVPADAGGTATVSGSSGQFTLPPAAVQRADGSAPAGNLRVRLTPIDPSIDSSLMPGDFTTLVAGVASLIESFGAFDIAVVDSSGAPVSLRSGLTATVRIPLASRNASPPATIPLFYFDTTTGRWVTEGAATLAGSGSNKYYQGTVSRFGTWNADQVMSTVQVTGCLVDASGARVSGGQIRVDGINYSGISAASTDSAGNFAIPLRKDGTATIVGQANSLLSNTLRIGPYSADAQVTPCLGLGQAGAGVTMKLTWGAAPSDLDSYLYTPNGSPVYFISQGNLLSAPFANLDVDDTSSYGPEVITITKLMIGTYKYAVHNYSGQSSGRIGASSARVELSLPGRAVELFTPPSTGESLSTGWWQPFEFDVDARCNITVRRTGIFSSSSPTAPASGTPTYCTP